MKKIIRLATPLDALLLPIRNACLKPSFVMVSLYQCILFTHVMHISIALCDAGHLFKLELQNIVRCFKEVYDEQSQAKKIRK